MFYGSETFYALAGILIMVVILVLLLWDKTIPPVVLITVPIVIGLLCGFSFTDLCGYIKDGVTSVSGNVVLFVFSVMFFGIISDTGIFDIVVSKLAKKAGNNIMLVFAITIVVSIIGHLDGAGATTFLIAVPPMLIIFRKLSISPNILFTLVCLAAGVMNVVPWGGPTGRIASLLSIDPMEIWHYTLPAQIFGIVLVFLVAFYFSIREKKRLGNNLAAAHTIHEELAVDEAVLALRRPKLIWVNGLLIVGVIAMMFIKGIVLFLPFMIGTVLALFINYPKPKEQSARIKDHSADALIMALTVMAVGVMSGVVNNSPIGGAMINFLVYSMPQAIASHLHVLWSVISVPVGLIFNGVDEYGLVPMIANAATNFGIDKAAAAGTWIIGYMPGAYFQTATTAMWIGLGLAGISYREHIKTGIKWAFLISVLQVIFMVVTGAVPF